MSALMKERVLMGWSGGKDSAMALYELKKENDVEVAAVSFPVDRSPFPVLR
jgi:tRNA(Ile)-lysidine synthase TilS/MesJ